MEEVESKALSSYKGTTPSHWFRYVDNTWVKIKTQEVEAFIVHINLVKINIKFMKEDAKDHKLLLLDCSVYIEEDGSMTFTGNPHIQTSICLSTHIIH